MSKIKELSGQRFGRLTVIRQTNERRRCRVVWECECDCGNLTKTISSSLLNGETRSCGCLRKELSSRRLGSMTTIHGHTSKHSTSGTYHSWISMKTRCENQNHMAYKRYGGRGIKICERWLKFENFLQDMGERPKGLTLERKDNDGNYEPENCKWATSKEQTRNSIQTKLNPLKVQVIKKLLKESKLMQKEIAEIFRVKAGTITAIAKNRNWKEI